MTKKLEVFETVSKPLSWLKPAPYNPRDITEERRKMLEASIFEWGLTVPFVATGDGELIGGHQRLDVILDMRARGVLDAEGDVLVPVIVRDGLSPAQTKKLNVLLNAHFGRFNMSGLRDVFASIANEEALSSPVDLDLYASGFTPDEVRATLEVFEVPTELAREAARNAAPDVHTSARPSATTRFSFVVPVAAAPKVRGMLDAFRMASWDVARKWAGEGEEPVNGDDAAFLAAVVGLQGHFPERAAELVVEETKADKPPAKRRRKKG